MGLVGGSSSSDEGGTECCTLPNGKSTSQVRGVAVNSLAAAKLSSSRAGRRRSSAAMSEVRNSFLVKKQRKGEKIFLDVKFEMENWVCI